MSCLHFRVTHESVCFYLRPRASPRVIASSPFYSPTVSDMRHLSSTCVDLVHE